MSEDIKTINALIEKLDEINRQADQDYILGTPAMINAVDRMAIRRQIRNNLQVLGLSSSAVDLLMRTRK